MQRLNDPHKVPVIGDQIVYIPYHVIEEDLTHPDVEFGFVSNFCKNEMYVFCRYWSKINPTELRTKVNSERTPVDCLYYYDSVPEERIDAWFYEMENER